MKTKGLLVVVVVFLFLVLLLLWWHGPITQDQAYHRFADDRMVAWNIPNTLNVVSNLAFLSASYFGLAVLAMDYALFRDDKRERPAYFVLFVSLAGVAVGSSFYHADPNDATLVWDRLPMSIAFMAVVTIVATEKVSLGMWKALFPLTVVGALTVLHWKWSGDLRWYVLAQAAPMIGTPILVYTFPDSYTHASHMNVCALLYLLSKIAETLDHVIYNATGQWLSGHTLKHVLAAIGLCFIPLMLYLRKPVTTDTTTTTPLLPLKME